jgi:hypothetical protein
MDLSDILRTTRSRRGGPSSLGSMSLLSRVMPLDVFSGSRDCAERLRLLASRPRRLLADQERHLPFGYRLLSGLLRFFAAGLLGLIRPQHRSTAFASRHFVSLGPDFDNLPRE